MDTTAADTITVVATPSQYGGKSKNIKVAGRWVTAKPQPIAVQVQVKTGRVKFYRLDVDGWTFTGRGRFVDGELKNRPMPVLTDQELAAERRALQLMPHLSVAAKSYFNNAIADALAKASKA